MAFVSSPKRLIGIQPHYNPSAHHGRRRKRCRFLWLFIVGSLLAISSWILHRLYRWNQKFVIQELEAPFDHLTSNLLKPLYSYNCPTLKDIQQQSPPLAHPFPRIVMISARPPKQVEPILQTWIQGGFDRVEVISTANISSQYINQRCQKKSWKSRLFGIYQTVIAQLLQNDPSLDYVVTLEDDVMLQNGPLFRQEIYYALHRGFDFYSLHKTSSDSSSSNQQQQCLYQWGTQAQLWSRSMLQRTLQVSNDTYCRLPIDMFLAQQGPWYVTQQDLVRHVGKRFHLPKT